MILSNFFDSFYENVKSLPPLALFSDDRNNNIISNSSSNNSNENEKSYFEKVLPYPELAYLSNGNANSTNTNSHDKKKDPLGLIEKIVESVENFVVVVIKYLIFETLY